MRRIIAIMLLSSIFISCHPGIKRSMTVNIPPETIAERLLGETSRFELILFNGETVEEIKLPLARRSAEINIYPSSLVLMLLVPENGTSPLASSYEPGMKTDEVTFDYGSAPLIEELIDISRTRPELVSALSLSFFKRYHSNLSAVDPSSFIRALNGRLDEKTEAVEWKEVEVVLEALPSGLWETMRDDVESFRVRESGESITLSLFPGSYDFYSSERLLLVHIAVMSDGRADSFISVPPKSFRAINKAQNSDV